MYCIHCRQVTQLGYFCSSFFNALVANGEKVIFGSDLQISPFFRELVLWFLYSTFVLNLIYVVVLDFAILQAPFDSPRIAFMSEPDFKNCFQPLAPQVYGIIEIFSDKCFSLWIKKKCKLSLISVYWKITVNFLRFVQPWMTQSLPPIFW